MIYGQLSWIRSDKFLMCFQSGKQGRGNNGISGYLKTESKGPASLSLQDCLLYRKRVHLGVEEQHIHTVQHLWCFLSTVSWAYICYTWIFILCKVLLCISHALLFHLGLQRIRCPAKLICSIISLKFLD